MSLRWPSLVCKEYEHWENERQCLNARFLNSSLDLEGDSRFIEDRPPCFFAGRLGESKIMLLSLNPGFKGKRNLVEYRIFKERGWEETYLTFFDWFEKEGLSSPYYSRFAVFLSGYLGLDSFPVERRNRFRLLGENLVNIDLIPYHSVSFTIKVSRMTGMLEGYVENLKELVGLAKLEAIFMNGAVFKDLLPSLGVVIDRYESLTVNKKQGRKLKVGLGHMHAGNNSIPAVWITNFLTGRTLAATNEGLFWAGKEIAGKMLEYRSERDTGDSPYVSEKRNDLKRTQ